MMMVDWEFPNQTLRKDTPGVRDIKGAILFCMYGIDYFST